MTIAFTKSSLPFGWLGNMSPHPVKALGEVWPRAEHLFQAMRLDRAYWSAIRNEPNPMCAKILAAAFRRDYPDDVRVEPLSEEDVDNMHFVVRAKLRTNPQLREDLFATVDQFIVEDVSSRAGKGSALFWGAAKVSLDYVAEEGSPRLWNAEGQIWQGRNELGRVWMKERRLLP